MGGNNLDALLSSEFSARYLSRLPEELREACLRTLRIPGTTSVDDVVCIPSDVVKDGLRKVVIGDTAAEITPMQIGTRPISMVSIKGGFEKTEPGAFFDRVH